jgi:hypothetical protein
MMVEFNAEDGRTIAGTVARLNQKTATVITAVGRWRISPSFLRPVQVADDTATPGSRVIAMPRRGE